MDNQFIELISKEEWSEIITVDVKPSIYKVVGECKISQIVDLIDPQKLYSSRVMSHYFCQTNCGYSTYNSWLRKEGKKIFFFKEIDRVVVAIFTVSVEDKIVSFAYYLDSEQIKTLVLSECDRIIVSAI